jgi:hypothetical protein
MPITSAEFLRDHPDSVLSNQALLLHLYGYEPQTSPGPKRSDKRTQLVNTAGAALIEHGLRPHVIISGAKMAGGNESLAELSVEDFLQRVQQEPQHISVYPKVPATTYGELIMLRNVAKNEGLQFLLSICWGIHEERVKFLASQIFRNTEMLITVLAAENILTANQGTIAIPDPAYRQTFGQLIDEIHNSESETRWKGYEKWVKFLMKFPFAPWMSYQIARVHRPKAD